MCSIPIDRRTISVLTPAFSSSCSLSWRCVVVAGWQASDLASPILTKRVISCSASIKRAPASKPPFTPKVKIAEGVPFMYFLASSCSGWSGKPAYFTQATLSWSRRYSATACAFCTWRSIRRLNVSIPCKIPKAFNGLSAAPVLRSGATRARAIKAAAPTSFTKFTPW